MKIDAILERYCLDARKNSGVSKPTTSQKKDSSTQKKKEKLYSRAGVSFNFDAPTGNTRLLTFIHFDKEYPKEVAIKKAEEMFYKQLHVSTRFQKGYPQDFHHTTLRVGDDVVYSKMSDRSPFIKTPLSSEYNDSNKKKLVKINNISPW